MSQIEGGPRRVRAQSDTGIYVVMVAIAFVALALAVGVVWYKNVELTGETNPFVVVEEPRR